MRLFKFQTIHVAEALSRIFLKYPLKEYFFAHKIINVETLNSPKVNSYQLSYNLRLTPFKSNNGYNNVCRDSITDLFNKMNIFLCRQIMYVREVLYIVYIKMDKTSWTYSIMVLILDGFTSYLA